MSLLTVKVARRWPEAEGVLGLELRDAAGGTLPAFSAGAHLDLHLPGGLVRSYSLCNDPRERDRYQLGVALSPQSRGGSRQVHEAVQAGELLQVSAPRNLFALPEGSPSLLFVAGGIGITPVLAMVHEAGARGLDWRLLYCVRSRERAAYAPQLRDHGARVRLHASDTAGRADVSAFLAVHATPGAHVYCCGPSGLMEAVTSACSRLPVAEVHVERFSAAAEPARASGAFELHLVRSNRRLPVPADRSILDTLEADGMALPFSCREGLCRSCEVPMCGGEADHRDHVLSDAERAAHNTILICVSRARSPCIALDL